MNILFLGHSLIEFYDWQKRFPRHRVVNLGIAGESVEGLLARLDGIINRHPHADLIFVMTGINNIAMEDLDFLAPYRKIITRLSSSYSGAKIFVHSLLPVLVDFIDNMTIIQVNVSIQALAGETGAEFIDIHKYFIDDEGSPVREYLLEDGVHLSGKGYQVWSGVIQKIIERGSS